MSEIFDAIYCGNFEGVKRVVNRDPQCLHIKNFLQLSPLDVAIQYGNLEIVKFLWEIDGRPDLEKYHNKKCTPAHDAVQWGHTAILKWIFAENVLPLSMLNAQNACCQTPLDVAIENGRLEMMQYLWDMGGQPNLEIYRDGEQTPVHRAACYGCIVTLVWVFTGGILPLHVLNIKDEVQWTPFDVAIAHGKLDTVQFLFEMGGRPNLDIYNRDRILTPVHCAARHGYTVTLKWVFTKNVLSLDVLNAQNACCQTPLDDAIAWGKLEMVQYLWKKGGRPNLENYRDGKNTPVHRAALRGYITTLEWVFTENVLSLDVLNSKNNDKRTPLDCAIDRKCQKTTNLLRRLMYVDPVFLALQRAKRDQNSLLRRLPNELLDMVVEEVAARFDFVVEWC